VVTGNYDGTVSTTRPLLQHTSGMVRDPRDAQQAPDGVLDGEHDGDVVSPGALARLRDTVPYLNGHGMGLGLNDR